MTTYAVIHADSGKEISYHPTIPQALDAIRSYERADAVYGLHEEYDWKVIED